MTRSLQRLKQIRKPDEFNDQQNAATVAASEAATTDYGEFQNALLSQIKRIIHGNNPGNWYDDPYSEFGGDASLYGLFQFDTSEYQKNLLDNNTDYIVIGDKTEHRKVAITYTFELPSSGRSLTGTFVFNHDGTNVDLDNSYSYIEPEITGVTFGGTIVGNELRIAIVTSGIGEDPKMRYRRSTLGIVT